MMFVFTFSVYMTINFWTCVFYAVSHFICEYMMHEETYVVNVVPQVGLGPMLSLDIIPRLYFRSYYLMLGTVAFVWVTLDTYTFKRYNTQQGIRLPYGWGIHLSPITEKRRVEVYRKVFKCVLVTSGLSLSTVVFLIVPPGHISERWMWIHLHDFMFLVLHVGAIYLQLVCNIDYMTMLVERYIKIT